MTTDPTQQPPQPEPKRTQKDPPNEPKKPPVQEPSPDEHEGATETEIGDRKGPGAGYDEEPEQVKDKGGVTPS